MGRLPPDKLLTALLKPKPNANPSYPRALSGCDSLALQELSEARMLELGFGDKGKEATIYFLNLSDEGQM